MADPVADFLAREQNDLAGIDDELAPVPNSHPVSNGMDQDFKLENGTENGGANMNFEADAGIIDNSDHFDQQPIPTLEERMREEKPSAPRPVTEKIRKWQEEQKKRLEKKDAEEAKKIAEMRDQAKRDLEKFNKDRKEQIEKNKKNNKDAEAAFLRERDATKPGKEWERIAGLCEFNPKNSKNTKDVTRMRGLLLQMKAEK